MLSTHSEEEDGGISSSKKIFEKSFVTLFKYETVTFGRMEMR